MPQHPAPHTIVTLYEDSHGHLFIHLNGEDYAWNITPDYLPDEFESNSVVLLNDDTDDWTVDRVPVSDLNHPNMRLVATYSDYDHSITIHRDPASGRLMAGVGTRRYLGLSENGEG